MVRRRAGRLGSCLLLLVAASALVGGAPARLAAPATVTILHVNDAHEMDAAEGGSIGGLARVATLLSRLRRATNPVFVTFGGDFLSPAAIGTAVVDGEPLAGRQAVAVMNLLGVQWATLGNHEFDFAEAVFRARLAESRFGVVSSNVTDANGAPFPGTVRSTVVPLRAGGRTIRIGLIGLTIDFNRKAWVRYLPTVESAKEQVAALGGRTDAIIALTHLGLSGDVELANAVPDLDLILGGHEHENWILRRGQHLTPIMKADANGRSAVVATLTFPTPGARPDVAGRVEVLGADVPPESRVRAEISRWRDLAFAAFRKGGFVPDETVAVVPAPLDGRESTVRNRPGNLTDIILAAMLREAPAASVAILNGGSIRVDDILPAGPVRQYDVLRVLPFGGKVVSASFEGAVLTQVLDAGIVNAGTGGFLHVFGAERTTEGWRAAGQPIDAARRYRVAMPEFLLTGGEARMAFLTRTSPQVHDVGEHRDIRMALIDELARRW